MQYVIASLQKTPKKGLQQVQSKLKCLVKWNTDIKTYKKFKHISYAAFFKWA